MRVETTKITVHKYFVTCPECKKERYVYGKAEADYLCPICASKLRYDKTVAKYKPQFDAFIDDVSGKFEFNAEASEEHSACCLTDTINLVGKSGKIYILTAYEDHLELSE